MNRVINLSRTDPSEKDLLQSAESIAETASHFFRTKYLANLVKWYTKYLKALSLSPQYRSFHGLRDFYSLIKFISQRIVTEDEVENERIIV